MKYSKEINNLLFSIEKSGKIDKSHFDIFVLRDLLKDGYIVNSNDYNDKMVYLTDRGRAYLDSIKDYNSEKLSDRTHRWINTIVAVLSLVIATASIILDIAQLMK